MTFFREKISIFDAIDQVFLILRIFTVLMSSYMTLSSQEKPLFHKRIP